MLMQLDTAIYAGPVAERLQKLLRLHIVFHVNASCQARVSAKADLATPLDPLTSALHGTAMARLEDLLEIFPLTATLFRVTQDRGTSRSCWRIPVQSKLFATDFGIV